MTKRVHFMGIGGSGSSSIASIARAEGFLVSGCDRVSPVNEYTREFDPALLFEGHSAEHLYHSFLHSPLAPFDGADEEQNIKQQTDPRLPTSPRLRGTSREDDDIVEETGDNIAAHNSSPITHNHSVDILAISPAITSLDPDNEELKKARELGIRVMTWQEFMGEYLEKDKFVIAVCGTHGKSTTTAMIGHVLEEAGLDPTVELGAVVSKWGRNYRISGLANRRTSGKEDPHPPTSPIHSAKASQIRRLRGTGDPLPQESEGIQLNSILQNDSDSSSDSLVRQSANSLTQSIFLTEADEFNNNFLVSHPDITVLTNLDMDHPEFFKDFQDYTDSFEKFLLQNKGVIVANLADTNVAEMMKWIRKHTNSECLDYSRHELQLDLKVMGEHNLSNAKAAFQVGLLLGIEPMKIIQALNSFTGIGRRQELVGERNGAKVYSDYAHHPKELSVTLKAFRDAFPDKKITAIFQPHMFTRTKALFSEFVEVLKKAPVHKLIVTDIFQSREKDPGDMHAKMLVEAVDLAHVSYIPFTDLPQQLETLALKDQIFVFCGAGDIDKVARSFVDD